MRLLLAAAAVCWATAQLPAASLAQQITDVLQRSPEAQSASWGIEIEQADNGKVLYARNAQRFFVPASNAKLFTMALALLRLGPNYQFHTRVFADGLPDADGRTHGALRLVGGGDPNLSGRAIPYRKSAPPGNPLAALGELADQVAAHGVKRVEGGIVGDDSLYVWEPHAPGWSIDDAQYNYGAPVSALTINDNSLTITARPGARAGDLATLELSPPVAYYTIDNRLRTVGSGGARKIQMEREPGSRQVRLWGTIPLGGPEEELDLAIEDPAEYAARAFRRALEQRGVVVEGGISVKHRFRNEGPAAAGQDGVGLADHLSAPLLEDLRVIAKVSQNVHAELALRAVGLARQGAGSREAGLAEMKIFLKEIGIDADTYDLNDGSGLTRLDLVTPDAVMRLLRFLYGSQEWMDWLSLLPVGGTDGTLSDRFVNTPGGSRIHAKTGSLTHVSALSGYAQRRNGKWVAFSILVNNSSGDAAGVRGVMDRICTLIVK